MAAAAQVLCDRRQRGEARRGALMPAELMAISGHENPPPPLAVEHGP
jgi:hypothetical protein